MLPSPHTSIERLAGADTLLVCMDFDGTICPLGTDAYTVTPDPRAIAALETLAQLPGTDVAILSGRHLDGLRKVCPLGPPVTLVGSHGAEPTTGGPELSPDDLAYLAEIQHSLEQLIDAPSNTHPGAFVETKPYQRVLHVMKLAESDPAAAAAILQQAKDLPSHGRPVTPGHNILEFSALDIAKGSWLEAEKTRYSATLFAGDDVTDETALKVLDTSSGADVGIKVRPAGAGNTGAAPSDTAANYQIGSVSQVADFLTELAAARQSAQAETPSAK